MSRIQRLILRVIAPTALALLAPAVHAQGIELSTKAEREIEVVEKGVKVKKLVPPQKMVPGDEVVYTVSYTNKGPKPAENVTITNPVPQHTRYKDGSAAGAAAEITFSADGGKTFAPPDKLTVTAKDNTGKQLVVRPAVAAEYTHIRWVIKQNVAPGQSGTVTFRALIL